MPPPHLDNLVVALWDKHMRPDWRDAAESPEQVLARRRATSTDGSSRPYVDNEKISSYC
jgi:hypothetical protein